jgi:tRNA modification GTPase
VLQRTVDLPRIIIGTHSDLPPHPDAPVMDISVNNLSGEGLDALQAAIVAVLGEAQSTGGTAVLTSQRQHGLLIAAARHLRDAATALLGPWGPAVAAEEVVRALVSLTDINSTDAREQVLDRLFSRFCIGK